MHIIIAIVITTTATVTSAPPIAPSIPLITKSAAFSQPKCRSIISPDNITEPGLTFKGFRVLNPHHTQQHLHHGVHHLVQVGVLGRSSVCRLENRVAAGVVLRGFTSCEAGDAGRTLSS